MTLNRMVGGSIRSRSIQKGNKMLKDIIETLLEIGYDVLDTLFEFEEE